jgi:hypothetical protein
VQAPGEAGVAAPASVGSSTSAAARRVGRVVLRQFSVIGWAPELWMARRVKRLSRSGWLGLAQLQPCA